LPDADAKAREYERFVDDLRVAAELLRKNRRARLVLKKRERTFFPSLVGEGGFTKAKDG